MSQLLQVTGQSRHSDTLPPHSNTLPPHSDTLPPHAAPHHAAQAAEVLLPHLDSWVTPLLFYKKGSASNCHSPTVASFF